MKKEPELRKCRVCKRKVALLEEEFLCTHGPGPQGEFICPGSGDKIAVRVTKHLNGNDLSEPKEPA